MQALDAGHRCIQRWKLIVDPLDVPMGIVLLCCRMEFDRVTHSLTDHLYALFLAFVIKLTHRLREKPHKNQCFKR